MCVSLSVPSLFVGAGGSMDEYSVLCTSEHLCQSLSEGLECEHTSKHKYINYMLNLHTSH